jgi:RimJ/RimL family protein N-acetyltransferase
VKLYSGFEDSEEMITELKTNYRPEYDENGRQTQFGFYTMVDGLLAGGSLLGVDDWYDARGNTGADTFMHMRGKGIAPGSKPHLFYLGFELLGLNRIETGCFVSNHASKRSIEKTPGFQFECVAREHGRNDREEFEDTYLYAIVKRDWERLYDKSTVEVIP